MHQRQQPQSPSSRASGFAVILTAKVGLNPLLESMDKHTKIIIGAAVAGLAIGFIAAGAQSATGIYSVGAVNGVEAGFGSQLASIYNSGNTLALTGAAS